MGAGAQNVGFCYYSQTVGGMTKSHNSIKIDGHSRKSSHKPKVTSKLLSVCVAPLICVCNSNVLRVACRTGHSNKLTTNRHDPWSV